MKNAAKPAAKSTKPAVKAPAKKAVAAVVEAGRLVPVVAADEDAVIAAAYDGVRRRPVVAINADGDMVVCCRRTATKNGWTLEGTLFARNRTGKVLVDAKGKLALADAKPARTKPVTKADFIKKITKSIEDILA